MQRPELGMNVTIIFPTVDTNAQTPNRRRLGLLDACNHDSLALLLENFVTRNWFSQKQTYPTPPIAVIPTPNHQSQSARDDCVRSICEFLFKGNTKSPSPCKLRFTLLVPVDLAPFGDVGFNVCVGSIWGGL